MNKWALLTLCVFTIFVGACCSSLIDSLASREPEPWHKNVAQQVIGALTMWVTVLLCGYKPSGQLEKKA